MQITGIPDSSVATAPEGNLYSAIKSRQFMSTDSIVSTDSTSVQGWSATSHATTGHSAPLSPTTPEQFTQRDYNLLNGYSPLYQYTIVII